MQVEAFATSRRRRTGLAARAMSVLAIVCITLAAVLPATAATLDRVRETGRIKFGYLVDSRPFTFRNSSGTADGYAVALCGQIAAQVKMQLKLPTLTVDWVPVTVDDRLREVQQGNIDLLCAPAAVTLSRRKDVAFSIPVFAGGNRAVLRTDSAAALRRALAENPEVRPVWRGSPAAKVLQNTTFAVVADTTTQRWLEARRHTFQIDAKIVAVPSYRAGLEQLLARKVDVFFGERSVVLGILDEATRQKVVIFDRLFTHEAGALALPHGDDEFRLLVDTALSRTYASSEFPDLYTKWFGEFDANTRAFFTWTTIEP